MEPARDTQQIAHHRSRIHASVFMDPGVLHIDSLAKYAAAFLRNTLRSLKLIPKFSSPSVQVLHYTVTVQS